MGDEVTLLLFRYDLGRRQLLHCNQHCQTVLGYSRQEMLALGPDFDATILHSAALAELQKTDFRQALAAGRHQVLRGTSRCRHRDGSWRWLRIRVRASTYGPDGYVQEIAGSAEDITRHHAAVAELRQNRHLLRHVVDLMPNLVYIYDLREERNTYTNQRIESLLGYTSEEIRAFARGTLLPQLLPPDSLAQLLKHLAAVARLPDGESLSLEFAVRHRDGSLRWQRGTHSPFARDADGQATSIIGVVEDVTEQRALREQDRAASSRLTEQHRLFRGVIDAIPHPIYLKNGRGNYLLANHALAALFDLTTDELLRYGDAIITSDTTRYRSQDQQVLATGQNVMLEESYTYPNGRVEWFSSVKQLFVGADGTPQVLGVDSNITELKRTQQALEAAIAAAQVDAQAKQDFLANMSHEIRTPLHGILGLTGVLAKTTLSRSQHDYLRLLEQSAEHLLTVLNDVLTTARLGAGKLRPETAPLDPGQLLTDCAALLRPRAREKGLRLRVDKPAAGPAVLGDLHRLRQVLLNLVSNAIKFTATGRVQLSCRPVPAGAAAPTGAVWLRFAVSDTGIGIAPEALDRVFEPFGQATTSTDREYGGSGLGLSISEGLVQLMGGVLRVSSEVGQGSTFAFTLPLQPVPNKGPAAMGEVPPAPAALAGGRVLLVEDNLVNSLLAETVLRNWGWQVTTAASGPAAIQLFEHRPFDLVLMDIQMPGMDGETAARTLRAHPDPGRAATPIIALTARAQAGEADRLLAAGFAGYLTKPYREEQLLKTIQAVQARQHRMAEPLAPYSIPTMLSIPPLYDLGNVRQLVRHDETIVRRLAWAFIETTPAILTALDEALTRADWEGVGDAAHHLKSSLDGLAVASLRQVIREMEAYGSMPPAPAHAAHEVARVRAITEQVMASLRQEFPEQR
ncbi:MAG: hypothetical protein NVS3B25_22650 [Hymenobacter sp.]